MTDTQWLAGVFERARPRLQQVAHRMLGSAAESEDALQETWLRISGADVTAVSNLEGWLTTVVARICLDALKRRRARKEDFTFEDPRLERPSSERAEHPEQEAVLADSIGIALVVLLDALAPAERVAYVLHDIFDVPFNDIAEIVGRTPEAARQLASRARRRVRGPFEDRDNVTRRHDELVRAFLAASRSGNFSALIALLDPKVTLRGDAAVVAMGGADYWQTDRLGAGVHGAEAVSKMFAGRANAAIPALIDGHAGAAWIHERDVRVLFRFTISSDRITGIDLIGDRATIATAAIERA